MSNQSIPSGSQRVLKYENIDADGDRAFRYVSGIADAAVTLAGIGSVAPVEFTRAHIKLLVSHLLLLVDDLYERGWEDLLSPLEVVFEIAGNPLDAACKRNDVVLGGALADLAGDPDDIARIVSESVARVNAVSQLHDDAPSKPLSGVGVCGAPNPTQAIDLDSDAEGVVVDEVV